MKKIILILLFLCSFIYADEGFRESSKWYLKGGLGINYLSPIEEGETKLDFSTGVYTNVSIGYLFKENLHAEVEGSYRNNAGSRIKESKINGNLDGSVDTISAMLNLLLDLPFEERFTLSVGGGIGAYTTTGKLSYYVYNKLGQLENTHNIDLKNEGFVGQGIVRLLVQFHPRFGVCAEYKYWKVPMYHQNNTLAMNVKLNF